MKRILVTIGTAALLAVASFVTTERWPVYLGSDGNAAYKITVLRELTAVLTRNGSQVVYIDLKNERRPAIKLAAG